MDFSYYHGSYIGVGKITGDFEFLAENIELSVASDKPGQGDVAIRNMPDLRQLGIWP